MPGLSLAGAISHTHEVAWNLYGPSLGRSPLTAMEVGGGKVLTYQGLSTARNLALVYAFTGSVPATLGYGKAERPVEPPTLMRQHRRFGSVLVRQEAPHR